MFEVGNILASSHGYNCTLVDFYEVVRVTKSNVWLHRLGIRFAEHDGYGQVGKVLPADYRLSDKPIMRRIQYSEYSDGNYVAISKYEYAYLWDNKPMYYNSMD